MFLIRRAKSEDVATLFKLAKMVHFINLPADRDIIAGKVMHSRECFSKAGAKAHGIIHEPAMPVAYAASTKRLPASMVGLGQSVQKSDLFMFVIEDTESGSVLGTSQVLAHMGGPGNPNVSFKLTTKEFFSSSLQTGTKHTVAQLYLDESGPTEIGGLILQPSFRGHKQGLGKMLSLIRFHFMALHRTFFADRVIAEMMAPITPDGQNLLWEYLGRRFINLTYTEADRFCQYSREFMTSLLPREEIYLTLLPPEARSVVGQVGPETVPARRMLEKLGFAYRDFIDPFDGGPHLEADTDEISIVKHTTRGTLGEPISTSAAKKSGYISVIDADGEFRALQGEYSIERNTIRVTKATMDALAAEPGMIAGVTPSDIIDGDRHGHRDAQRSDAKGGKQTKTSKKKVSA